MNRTARSRELAAVVAADQGAQFVGLDLSHGTAPMIKFKLVENGMHNLQVTSHSFHGEIL